MLFIIFICAALALIWIGVGLLFFPPRTNRLPFRSLLYHFWAGWALVIAFLEVWHLFFPIGAAAFLFILIAGIVGWYRARAGVWQQIKLWGIPRITLVGGLALVLLVVLSSHVMNSSPHYDHGLYHYQAVQWLNRYAIVPGLGNLHHRLAFNNSNFLFSAVINWGPFADRAYYLSSPLLAFLLLLACLDGFYQLFQPEGRRKVSSMFYAWMLPISLWQFGKLAFSGYSPDLVVFILQVVVSGIFLELYESEDQAEADWQLTLLVLLAAVGMTVKASVFVFSILVILLALRFTRSRYAGHIWQEGNFLRQVGLAGLILIPWVLRNIILSGYPFFPGTALPMPVPWRMPTALVQPIAPTITDWARTMSRTIPYTGDWKWFLEWWKQFPFIPVQRAFLTSIALIVGNVGLVIWLRKKKTFHHEIAILFSIHALSVLYWFLLAPDYRFSGASIWLLFVCAALSAACLLEGAGKVQPVFIAAAVLLALTLWLDPNQFIVERPAGSLVFYPMPESTLLEMRYQPGPFETRYTNSGLAVQMPQEPADQCWYASLPCTRPQDFLLTLRLIDPRNVQKGFMIQ